MSELKHSLEENGFTLRTCEFKSQIDDIKVVHRLFNQGKLMKVLDRMNLGNSEIIVYPVMSSRDAGKKRCC